MKRGFFNAMAWVSLVGCVMISGLWARSYFAFGGLINVSGTGQERGALSFQGRLIFEVLKPKTKWWRPIWPEAPRWSLWTSPTGDSAIIAIPPGYEFDPGSFDATPPTHINRFGIIYSRKVNFGYFPGDELSFVSVPMWMIEAPACVLPLIRLSLAWKARRWRVEGRCRNCGYDLRATPERCPECGTAATKRENTNLTSAQAGRPGKSGGFVDGGPGPSGPG